MRLLLDTHIWIWSLEDPAKLRPKVAAALTDPRSELWISPISIWEFVLLAQLRKVRVRGIETPRAWVEAALSRVPMQEAAINGEVALRSRYVRVAHDDPADRFLAASADVYGLTLVTADERLIAGKGYRVLPNR